MFSFYPWKSSYPEGEENLHTLSEFESLGKYQQMLTFPNVEHSPGAKRGFVRLRRALRYRKPDKVRSLFSHEIKQNGTASGAKETPECPP